MTFNNYRNSTVVLLLLLGLAFLYHNVNVVKSMSLIEECTFMNHDSTRPTERYCTKPISLKDNVFKFENKSGQVEVYDIVKVDTEDGPRKYYLFMNYE